MKLEIRSPVSNKELKRGKENEEENNEYGISGKLATPTTKRTYKTRSSKSKNNGEITN